MNIVPLPRLQIQAVTSKNITEASDFLRMQWHACYDSHVTDQVSASHNADYFNNYLQRKEGLSWIANLGKRVIGLVTVSANCVDDLYVDTKYQRRKIGHKLLQTTLTHFIEKGFNSAQAGCEDLNLPAISFFTAEQWKIAGSEKLQLQPGKYVEALVFSRLLSSTN